jgi:hypothetical protein
MGQKLLWSWAKIQSLPVNGRSRKRLVKKEKEKPARQ